MLAIHGSREGEFRGTRLLGTIQGKREFIPDQFPAKKCLRKNAIFSDPSAAHFSSSEGPGNRFSDAVERSTNRTTPDFASSRSFAGLSKLTIVRGHKEPARGRMLTTLTRFDGPPQVRWARSTRSKTDKSVSRSNYSPSPHVPCRHFDAERHRTDLRLADLSFSKILR